MTERQASCLERQNTCKLKATEVCSPLRRWTMRRPKHGVAEWILNDLHVPVCASEVATWVPNVDRNRQATAVFNPLIHCWNCLSVLHIRRSHPSTTTQHRDAGYQRATFSLNTPFVQMEMEMESTAEHRPGQTEILFFSSRSFSAFCA